MFGGPTSNRRPSRDHIFPREWGGTFAPENIRRVCSDCNQLRALAGHCLAILACARAVAEHPKRYFPGQHPAAFYILKKWKASRFVIPPELPEVRFPYPRSYNEWKALKREEIAALKSKHQKPSN